MKYTSFFAFFVLLFSACIPAPIKVDIPEEPPRIIVASRVLPDYGLIVLLTNSLSSLQSVNIGGADTTGIDSSLLKSLVINKAFVSLKFDGKEEKLIRIGLGLYGTINLALKENKNYTLYVKDSLTGREVTATTTFTPPIALDVLTAKLESFKNPNGLSKDTLLTIKLQITDNPAQKNYYMLDYIGSKVTSGFGLGSFGLNTTKGSIDLFTSDIADVNHKIKIEKPIFQNPTDTFNVTLFKISKEYYEYQNSVKKSGGIFTQIISEPISLPSNVKDGQGFFNMAYPKVQAIYGKW